MWLRLPRDLWFYVSDFLPRNTCFAWVCRSWRSHVACLVPRPIASIMSKHWSEVKRLRYLVNSLISSAASVREFGQRCPTDSMLLVVAPQIQVPLWIQGWLDQLEEKWTPLHKCRRCSLLRCMCTECHCCFTEGTPNTRLTLGCSVLPFLLCPKEAHVALCEQREHQLLLHNTSFTKRTWSWCSKKCALRFLLKNALRALQTPGALLVPCTRFIDTSNVPKSSFFSQANKWPYAEPEWRQHHHYDRRKAYLNNVRSVPERITSALPFLSRSAGYVNLENRLYALCGITDCTGCLVPLSCDLVAVGSPDAS